VLGVPIEDKLEESHRVFILSRFLQGDPLIEQCIFVGRIDLQGVVEAGNGLLISGEVVQRDSLVDKNLRVDRVEGQGAVVCVQRFFILEQIGEDQPLPVPELGAVRNDGKELSDKMQGFFVLLVVEVVVDDLFDCLCIRQVSGSRPSGSPGTSATRLKTLPPPLVVFRVVVKIPEIENAHTTLPKGFSLSKSKKGVKSSSSNAFVDFQKAMGYINILILNDFRAY